MLLILPQNRGQTEINPISDKDLKFHKKKDKDVKYCGFWRLWNERGVENRARMDNDADEFFDKTPKLMMTL